MIMTCTIADIKAAWPGTTPEEWGLMGPEPEDDEVVVIEEAKPYTTLNRVRRRYWTLTRTIGDETQVCLEDIDNDDVIAILRHLDQLDDDSL